MSVAAPQNLFSMLIDIRPFCQHLKLDFDRADFKIADKGIIKTTGSTGGLLHPYKG